MQQKIHFYFSTLDNEELHASVAKTAVLSTPLRGKILYFKAKKAVQ